MKNLYKATLLAAIGLAGVTAAQAAITYNGDLMIGLTTQSGNDLVYDLGAYSTLMNGSTWDLSSALSAAGLSTSNSGLLWGVVGSSHTTSGTYARTEWLTDLAIPDTINNGEYASIDGAVGALQVNDFQSQGEGTYATPANTLTYSWNQETAQGGSALGSSYSAEYTNPNLAGLGSIEFYSSTAAGVVTDLGSFSLNGSTLSFVAVPEPATYSIVGAGFLILALRRQIKTKKA